MNGYQLRLGEGRACGEAEMRKLTVAAALLAGAIGLAGTVEAQAAPTYYYCYAFEPEGGGKRIWVSSVSFGDSDNFTEYHNAFKRRVRDAYNINYFSAIHCAPNVESTDRTNVEQQRSDLIYRERNSYGKNVIPFN
jgi:hypothetical protein